MALYTIDSDVLTIIHKRLQETGYVLVIFLYYSYNAELMFPLQEVSTWTLSSVGETYKSDILWLQLHHHDKFICLFTNDLIYSMTNVNFLL